MKVLIIRFSSIGDIVLTSPVVRTLKSQLGAEVHYVTKKQYYPLLEANPYLDKIHLLEGSLSGLIVMLRKERYDYVIDLHNNLRSQIIKLSVRGKKLTFNKLNIKKWLVVHFKVNLLPNVHIVERYMQTVALLGIKMDSLGLDYFIPYKDEIEDYWLPPSHRSGFAAFIIGAKFRTKQLPVRRMIELCDRINKPIVLIGGKEDEAMGREVESFFKPGTVEQERQMKELGKKAIIFNACGKFSINQSASIISKARWVFSHDTGMMHVAAAFKKPIYSIWGNTIPAFGMYPFRTQFTIFENNKLHCRPCSKIGFKKCPKGHFNCMNALTFDFYLPD